MNNILHMKRPRSRGHVTCDMCGTHVPRGVRYKRIEVPDMGTIVRCKRTERLGAAS